MQIKTLEVAGIGPAVRAMRNPFDSWDRSDTIHGRIGRKDMELSEKLAKAGPAHCKHLRLVQVWAEIWAPRFWWMEFATHRHGVEMLSCSTMHRLTARDLTPEDFEWSGSDYELRRLVEQLNELLHDYRTAGDCGAPSDQSLAWRELIECLPQSYIQRRTVMMSYAALRNMYQLREGHRLREWGKFRYWCRSLPESWMITGELPPTVGGADEVDDA